MSHSLLSQVIRARHTPAIVASILDARSEPELPLKALGHSIKTVSLANIDISVPMNDPPSNIINISPLSHLPESESEATNHEYDISTEDLAKIIEQHDALYFQHVVRPNGRHFCFYLDAFKLLGALDTADVSSISDTGRKVVGEFHKVIDKWVVPGQMVDLICVTNFPRSEKPSAAEIIATEVAEKYDTEVQAITITGDFIPLMKPRSSGANHRTDTPEQLAFLDLPEPQPPSTIVIVDWGSVTGKNIRDSIRFAAARGATRILVVIFLSQLPSDEERFLTHIHKVLPRAKEAAECEVTVKFLARFPIQAYDGLNCPYCRQIERLNKEDAYYPSYLLQNYHEEAKQRLRPRTLHEVREVHQPSQTAGENYLLDEINPNKHVTVIAEMRSRLEAARNYTNARFLLYQFLLEMEGATEQGDVQAKLKRSCLFRLLAVEWTWLKHEPLSLSLFKQQISGLAKGLILDASCLISDRRDAIVVLRTASKERFTQYLPELFNALITESPLLDQLLYGAFTYLQREYVMRESLLPLVNGLEQCTQEVRKRLGSSVDTEVGQTINSLFLLGIYISDAINEDETSPVGAWRILKREWADRYNAHHPLADSVRSLFLSYVEDVLLDANQELPEIDWRGIRDKWNLVERHLIRILRWLNPLRSVFEGLDSCGILPLGEGEDLAQAGTSEGVTRISTLRTQLDLFANSPKSVRAFGEWEAFKKERDWFWTLLLNPGREENGVTAQASTLITILQGCPCDITSVMSSVLQEPARKRHPLSVKIDNYFEDGTMVFCHEIVLSGCLRELLYNVEKHTEKADAQPINVLISIEEEDSYIYVTVKNDGTIKPSGGLRQGLIRYKQALQAYGGDLNGSKFEPSWGKTLNESVEGDSSNNTPEATLWIYEAKIELYRWRTP